MKKAIVTGANGFVGSALVKELAAQHVAVIALDREGCDNNIPKDSGISFVPCDLADMSPLLKTIPQDSYDCFYHFAWAGSAGAARSDTVLQLKNAQWTVDCLRLAKQLGCRRFLGAGSIMEHEAVASTFSPGIKPGLGTVYGGGKLISHVMCKAVAADIGIELVWPMITNAYGVGELSPRLVNTTIIKCINNESPSFTAATQNYDFVYIDDIARAFYLIGENGKPFCEYLIGSSNARPLKEFLLEIQAITAPGLEFVFGSIPFNGVDLPLSTFDCAATEKDTGFKAQISFSDGIKRTEEWLRTVTAKQE